MCYLQYLSQYPKASPTQIAFNRDMILNIKFITDWETIRFRKQRNVDKNNERENILKVYTMTTK